MPTEVNKRIMEPATIINLIESDLSGFRQLTSQEILEIAQDVQFLVNFSDEGQNIPVPKELGDITDFYLKVFSFLKNKIATLSDLDWQRVTALEWFSDTQAAKEM